MTTVDVYSALSVSRLSLSCRENMKYDCIMIMYMYTYQVLRSAHVKTRTE
jgi:hypothetical protein